MSDITIESLDINTIGHYKRCSSNCCYEKNIDKAVEDKCKLMSDIIEIYSRFDHLYNEAHLRIAFFGSMSYPIAKYIYKLIVNNYGIRLSINIFEKELKKCSNILRKNIEEGIKIGVFNFNPYETHCSNESYNTIVCSDMLFMEQNKASIFSEFCRILARGCFIIITDIFKKEGSDTTKMEDSLGIQPIDTLETTKINLWNATPFNNILNIVNVIDYSEDLEKHLKNIGNKILLENIEKLVYNIIILKKN